MSRPRLLVSVSMLCLGSLLVASAVGWAVLSWTKPASPITTPREAPRPNLRRRAVTQQVQEPSLVMEVPEVGGSFAAPAPRARIETRIPRRASASCSETALGDWTDPR